MQLHFQGCSQHNSADTSQGVENGWTKKDGWIKGALLSGKKN